MQNDEWFVRVHGKEYGPVDFETLREWKREGRLISDNEMRSPTETTWVKAGSIPELFADELQAIDANAGSSRRRTFGEIIIETFQIYRKGFPTFFFLALLLAVPSCVFKICLAYVHLPEREPAAGAAVTASAIAIVMLAIILALWPIFIAGIQIATADLAAGRNISLRDVLKYAVEFWPRVAKLCLVVYGSYFLWSIVPLLAILSLVAAQPSVVTVLLALAILALQVYMTARLWVNFLFWQQTSVLETHDALAALRESKDLARSRREASWHERPLWRGAILASIWFLLLIIFSTGAEVPFLLVRLQGLANVQDAVTLIQNISNAPAPDAMTLASYALSSLVHAFLRPLLGISFVILYFDAKAW
jgi:uncharacterized protein DUF4339